MKRILIVEDEKDLAELLSFNLEKEGYQTMTASNGKKGLEMALQEVPDLIILDLMLPEMTGTEICSALRHYGKTRYMPVIMLTARGDEIDRVVGFEVGADDYMVKPFSMRELLLRIKALLRRTGESQMKNTAVLSLGPLVIDQESLRVTVSGEYVELTSTEFKLLLFLAEHTGNVLKREVLLQNVWGLTFPGDTRTVDTHITRLRNKPGNAGDLIKTVRGFGYKIEEE